MEKIISCYLYQVHKWIAVNKLGIQAMVHVLENFLLIEQSKSLAVAKFAQFIDLCQQIGVPLSAKKTVFPTPIIDFFRNNSRYSQI